MRVDGRITQRHGLGILPAHVGAREREGRGGRLAQDAPYVPVSDRAGGAGEGRKTTSHEQRPALGAAATDASRLAARLAARDDGDSVAGAEAAAAAAADTTGAARAEGRRGGQGAGRPTRPDLQLRVEGPANHVVDKALDVPHRSPGGWIRPATLLDVGVHLHPPLGRHALGRRQGGVEVPVKHHSREHQAVQCVVVFQLPHEPETLDLASFLAADVPERLRGLCVFQPDLLVLPPPDLCDAVDKAVDLLHVRWDVELLEDLGQARHDTGAHQTDRVDVLESQRLGKRKVLPQELSNLRQAHGVLRQEATQLHGEVTHRPSGDEKRQALARSLVENLDSDVLQMS
mmetsp:Transcript_79749/g.215623  ORF Transcript_79749/g.215623 Transcript_79749/m.215623 type:complete len:345 (+) Transcript_79749:632-1666(+)